MKVAFQMNRATSLNYTFTKVERLTKNILCDYYFILGANKQHCLRLLLAQRSLLADLRRSQEVPRIKHG